MHRIVTAVTLASFSWASWLHAAAPGTFSKRIAVDQFGYMPGQKKIAVISDPQVGFNAAESYTPGPLLEVRTADSNLVVFAGAPAAWNGGATHGQSGDRAWWFDFSSVTKWGAYYVYDPSTDRRSARFRIDHRVYEDVLKHAVRVFYYQRRGHDKAVPCADPRWTDAVNFTGPLQDTQCRLVTNPLPSNEKDLRGGWFDAGDYNKYVAWTVDSLGEMLLGFRQSPLIWPDDWDIPESGNGIPDLLDELKWELDWLLRMQNPDGSVLSKVGVTAFQGASPPSATGDQTFYGEESTSASLTCAHNFALAVPAYQAVGMTAYATVLSNAAVAAYAWAVANPNVNYSNSGFSNASPEISAYERDMRRLSAAVYLYDITGVGVYRSYVEANYTSANALQWNWWGPYQAAVQDALLHYTTLAGVTPSVASTILNSKQSSINGGDFMGAYNAGTDPYRAHHSDATYHWGNNRIKAKSGALFALQNIYGLNPGLADDYHDAAAGYLNYLHGVNPLTMVYLSNMYDEGAETCANEMYHTWFGDGTIYDNALTSPNGPALGYLVGGANKNFVPDPSYGGPPLVPPMSQPVMKSYKDWNTSWPENSWEITEPSIGYQGGYVYLLSRFVRPMAYADWTTGHALNGAAADLFADDDGDGVVNAFEFAFDLDPKVKDAEHLPAFTLEPYDVGGQSNLYWSVTFPRQLGEPGLTYVCEASTNLVDWIPFCTAASSNPPSGPGFISETGTGYLREVRARETLGPASRVAVRFRLEWGN